MSNQLNSQDFVNTLVIMGFTAHYVTNTPGQYMKVFKNLTVMDVMIHIHEKGEDVILISENEIDVVRFKFYKKGNEPVRKQYGVGP